MAQLGVETMLGRRVVICVMPWRLEMGHIKLVRENEATGRLVYVVELERDKSYISFKPNELIPVKNVRV